MNEAEVFVLADHTLSGVVAQIQDDQWDIVMPAGFKTRAVNDALTLRELINYHAYDDAWVPSMLAGVTMEQAGRDRFDGDLLGDAPRKSFAAIVERACPAAAALDDLDRTVHCSFGDFRAQEFLWQANYFRGIRAHDIAAVIGADTTLPTALVRELWSELSPHAEQWRDIGVFGPAVDVAADAPLQDRLLALTGRDPQG